MKTDKPILQKVLSALLVWALAISVTAFDKEPIPQFPGDGNPQHENQPAWCANFDTKSHTHNCDCQAMTDKGDSCKHGDEYGPDTYDQDQVARCKTHCRREARTCERRCET